MVQFCSFRLEGLNDMKTWRFIQDFKISSKVPYDEREYFSKFRLVPMRTHVHDFKLFAFISANRIKMIQMKYQNFVIPHA